MWKNYRYLIARRSLQFSVLLLMAGGNYWGWQVLQGNFSAAMLLGTVPLADPYAFLQMLASGFWASTNVVLGAALVTLFYSLLGGRMFCAWVCPINPLSDAAQIGRAHV